MDTSVLDPEEYHPLAMLADLLELHPKKFEVYVNEGEPEVLAILIALN